MALLRLLFCAFVITTTTSGTDSKKVVLYPPPVPSYIGYHSNIAGELASLGHDVFLCLPHFLASKNVVQAKNVKILEYGRDHVGMDGIFKGSKHVLDKFWAGEKQIELLTLYDVGLLMNKFARAVLSDTAFIDTVRNLRPDLFVLDSIPFNLNMITIPYMLDIPYALIGTLHDVVLSKVPYNPTVPIFPGDKLSDNMSFFDRLQCIIVYILRINFDMFYDSSIVSEFAPHKPYQSINDLAAKAEIFLIEIDHILDYPRPMLPNTKLVGGSSASPAKPLVGDFKKFVEDSKSGIIVVSFGGSVVNIPPHITSKMTSAFKELDLRVIWRVNMTSPEPNQIMTSMWIPQNDLLGHEKTKLFVSHCGKNGQYEALYHAVPILCLPIFGDQGYNAERARVKQLGLRADMREASAEELAGLMKEIIYDKKYSENMKKASFLYRELYKVPKKEVAFWLDHVMEFGGDYMRSSGQEMPWYQILALDIIAFLICMISFILLFIYFAIKLCLRLCKGKQTKIKSKAE